MWHHAWNVLTGSDNLDWRINLYDVMVWGKIVEWCGLGFVIAWLVKVMMWKGRCSCCHYPTRHLTLYTPSAMLVLFEREKGSSTWAESPEVLDPEVAPIIQDLHTWIGDVPTGTKRTSKE